MTWEEVEIYNGLLDSYGGAAAAYSVRRLSSSYEGSLIQVERASDNTTQDIGYDSNGDLDTAAIATFCSGTNCTVRTWYDQSSNGNDAVQTTQANQPTIYTGGAVILENGEAAMNLTDGQGFTMTSAIGAGADKYPFLVHAADASDTSWSLYAESVSGNVTPLAEDGSTSTLLQSSPYDPLNAIFKDGSALTLTTRDALHANYVSAGQSLTTMHFEGSPGVAILFNRNGGRNYTGTVQELIFYTSDQSSNRSGIETNINDYFGIYTPFTTGLLDDYGGAAAAYSLRRLSSTYTGPLIRVRRASDNAEQDISADIEGNLNTGALAAFCSGTDGFVKTWYCQSGNGNDATQTTAANQPKIYDSSTGVVLENGEPALEFDGTSDQLSASVTIGSAAASTSFVVVNPDTISPNKRIYNMHDGATGDERNSSFVNSQFNIYDGTNGLTTGTTVAGTQYLITSRFVTGDGTIHANGTLQGTSASITQKAVNTLSIGKQDVGATFYLDGNMQEFVLYASDQSSNRSGIETNINDFYNIYP